MVPRRLAPLLALLLPAAAAGATFTVTKAADTADGVCDALDCSLREAVLAANGAADSTVEIPAGIYRLAIPRLPRGDNAPGDGTNGNLVVGVAIGTPGSRIAWVMASRSGAEPSEGDSTAVIGALIFGAGFAALTDLVLLALLT